MRILLTGHRGYVGSTLLPLLTSAGHEVIGMDSGLFCGHHLGIPPAEVPEIRQDIRDVEASDLAGFDAVIHLAGISNDLVGSLHPALTHAINGQATVRLGRLAESASVGRFVFASSCSVYGATSGALATEDTGTDPLTAYSKAKLWAERGLNDLAHAGFTVTSLRPATAYGYAPAMRTDLVVNDLVGAALLDGVVRLRSDGTAWRPFVHVEDLARAFVCAVEARTDGVVSRCLNVGQTAENHRILDIAKMVMEVVPGSEIEMAPEPTRDRRHYRVNFELIGETLPDFRPRRSLGEGIVHLRDAYLRFGLDDESFDFRFRRLATLTADRAAGIVATDLRAGARASA